MAKQPVRLITFAWGEQYIEELFSLTLPAVLAPNNLPALAQHFACEMVILTEEVWFESLRRHPVYFQLRRYCTVEFRSIDDLVNDRDAYGMTLTYALFRGFEELGPAMVDRQLIFFNADFILADGSLRTVGEKILAGERLILSPSYCVVSETASPWLMSRKDLNQGSLTVSPREMAAMALRHRHNTIRGKTVNQPAFSVEWMDQFYWLLDEHTMLAHQMPFAVVSMRPERVLTDMCTFWDYGIISEACPTTPRCVIADSDDFLMIELRSAETARNQLSLGWPEPKQIAKNLTQFITKDPIELARHTLVLHSGDLPVGFNDAKAKLDSFVEAVLAELPPEPTHWVNHPIWAYHYPRFHEARRAHLARLAETSAEAAENQPAQCESTDDQPLDSQPAETASVPPVGSRGLARVARLVYHKWFGRAPWLTPLHPRWGDVQPVLRILRERPEAPVLVVSSVWLPERLFGGLNAQHMNVAALAADAKIPPSCSDRENLERLGTDATKPTPFEAYSLCIFEVNRVDLAEISALVERVVPWMEPGAKIVIWHLNGSGSEVGSSLVGNDLLWLDRPYAIAFVGSALARRSINFFNSGVAAVRRRQAMAAVAGLIRVGAACLWSFQTRKENSVHFHRPIGEFTSLTIDIELPSLGGTFADSCNVLDAAE